MTVHSLALRLMNLYNLGIQFMCKFAVRRLVCVICLDRYDVVEL